MIVGDMTLKQLNTRLLDSLFKSKKIRITDFELTYCEDMGFLKLKVLFKKRRECFRYRTRLDIEQIQEIPYQEFVEFIIEQSSKYGEVRHKKS